MDRLAKFKGPIDESTSKYLRELFSNTSNIGGWKDNLLGVLEEFSKRGKSVRGKLALASCEMFGGVIDENALKVAAAIEIFNSALLIHDDIIDNDEIRRGGKTIFKHYIDFADKEGFDDREHFGKSMGICAGDICIGVVFDILGKLEISEDKKSKIISLFSGELASVGFAEMDDVYLGFSDKEFDRERILDMYKYKTGQYTFSVPLIAGSILAGKGDKDELNKLGHFLGIAYQVKDDELGIFGSESELGKPVGSDIIEDKKTLFRAYLFESVGEEERNRLKNIFGNKEIGEEEIEFVRGLMKRYSVRDRVDKDVEEVEKEAEEIINGLPVSESDREFLVDFLRYNIRRRR